MVCVAAGLTPEALGLPYIVGWAAGVTPEAKRQAIREALSPLPKAVSACLARIHAPTPAAGARSPVVDPPPAKLTGVTPWRALRRAHGPPPAASGPAMGGLPPIHNPRSPPHDGPWPTDPGGLRFLAPRPDAFRSPKEVFP